MKPNDTSGLMVHLYIQLSHNMVGGWGGGC